MSYFTLDTRFSDCGRPLDGQIGRLGALENAAQMDADLTCHLVETRAVADQPAGDHEIANAAHRDEVGAVPFGCDVPQALLSFRPVLAGLDDFN